MTPHGTVTSLDHWVLPIPYKPLLIRQPNDVNRGTILNINYTQLYSKNSKTKST